MVIKLDSIFLNTGWFEHRFVIPPAEQFWSTGAGGSLVPREGGILVARWAERFVECLWRLEDPQAEGAPHEGARVLTDPQAISQFIFERLNVRANLERKNQYLVTEITPRTRIVWICRIDTNAQELREACKKLAAERQDSLHVPITLTLIVKTAQGPVTHRKEITLELRPLRYPPAFAGVVALDLGNTHTCLAALDARDTPSTRQVKLLPDLAFHEESLNDRQLESQPPPIRSFLRIDAVTDVRDPSVASHGSPAEILAQPEAYAYRVGKGVEVLEEGPWGLIANPKRSVAADPTQFTHTIVTRAYSGFPAKPVYSAAIDYQVELPATRPAELFVARLLEGFRAIVGGWAQRLVVTYPSTFSATELARLRETVYRAWRIAERHNDRPLLSEDEVLPLFIDEASAAAFYYLARTVLEGPGGLRAFRWLYPQGFYLLVYDCGGATTDVAIVKAESTTPKHLQFTVLGRTGLRDFGGDEITVAIFLLLKAKLAEKLARVRARSVPRLPEVRRGDNPQARGPELRAFFADEQILEALDSLVPTDFDPRGYGHDTAVRQQLTWLLWSWAEECKKAISEGRGGQRVEAPAIFERLAKTLLDVNPGLGMEFADLKQLLPQVMPLREEVDALIWESVDRSVRLCRALARSKLEFRAGHLDDVFLVGYGSLYPLIRERIRREFLGETYSEKEESFRPSLFGLESTFMPEDLKNCVAKGAVLALALREATLGLSLGFDTELCRRLPFSVAWHNAATNTCVALYAEGERYEELAPKKIEVTALAKGQRPQWIRLMQRWPGAEYEPFLLFSFPEGVEGTVTIYFDTDTEQFVAVSEETGAEAIGQREIDPDVYRSAVQRGKIRLCRSAV